MVYTLLELVIKKVLEDPEATLAKAPWNRAVEVANPAQLAKAAEDARKINMEFSRVENARRLERPNYIER